MSELEALRWLQSQNVFVLLIKQDEKKYLIDIPGYPHVSGDSVLDCVIKMKDRICE